MYVVVMANLQQRTVLLSNSAFSLLSGLLFVIAPTSVADWLGLETSWPISSFGVVLLFHAAAIPGALGNLSERSVVLLNFAAIAPYAPLVIGLIGVGIIDRPVGQLLATIDAAIVGFFAIQHGRSLRVPKTTQQAHGL